MNIFVNKEEKRPRAGWRITLQFVLFLLTGLLLFAAGGQMISEDTTLMRSVILTVAAVTSVLLSAKFLDKRPVADYGLKQKRRWFKELAAGLVIGTLAVSFIFLTEWLSGWVTVTGYGWERTSAVPYAWWIGGYFIAMMLVGFYEELLFRGYQLINLMEGIQVRGMSFAKAVTGAVLVNSVFFGLVHAGNPGASWISTVNIMLAGAVLALPFILTGRLALSIGLHISWNFAQGGIWGFPVSGIVFRGSLIQSRQEGPDVLTGGGFGPEAGLLGIVALLFMAAVIYIYVKKTDVAGTPARPVRNTFSISRKTHEQGS